VAITGTQHPSSPQTSLQSNGNKVIVRRFQYARDDAWEADMPALGSFDASYGYFRGYRTTNGPAYLTVELVYDSEGTVINFSPGDGDTEYWAETRGDEVPIEYHPSYLVKWNHNLYSTKKGATPKDVTVFEDLLNDGSPAPPDADSKLLAAPEDKWDTMKDPASANTNGSVAVNLVDWTVTKGDPGIGWYIVKKKIKPGLEFYVRPQRVVVRRDYHRQQSSAESALAAVGTLSTPGETFGESGGNWLVMSSNTKYDGKYWVTETEYWYSDRQSETGIGWDTDIYATTTT